ncbi:MAG: tRNA (adenosine(37)-N6)-threonylcarbamoyltransferase complex ATPase subunit type 1 TsaE [Verrucomicrobia bacterium]|nr:tRNA (adenosine(37)-N6)-threonylcarbamoyltransferase complex ATPase subunit type 1 TsaE [Verrucomicrobiota bacterium]MCH8512058.1 tRNA (adenosine(37)-N6)-threonylcarbamoyltransferase complex ATPase subunit type 1 TsaE [Kiritimatiellia bacterium]
MKQRWTSHNPEETRALGAEFVKKCLPGDVVLLHGDLGLGKTCFVQGMAEGLGHGGNVTSPTYALIQEYDTTPPLAHADLYRLESADAIWGLGLDECMDAGMILAVEWSERAPGFWPAYAWHVTLAPGADEHSREIQVCRGGGS